MSNEPLWTNERYTPFWVSEELTRSMIMSHDGINNGDQNGKCDSALLALIKACAKRKDIEKGVILHQNLMKRGLLEINPYLASSLISMYAKCGVLSKAQQVLEDLRIRHVATWNALIAGYTRHGYGDEAMECFERMHSEGVSPNTVTFICILKACGVSGAILKGKQIHDKILHGGFLVNDVVVGTALVDMYAKCGVLSKAYQVLEELPFRNVVSWNALIAGYIQQGQGNEALNCFELMKSEVSPDAVTFISILKACGKVRDIDKGEQIHEDILSRGLLGKDIVLGCALVGMYTKCGVLAKAQQLLEEFPIRNIVSWSALIAGFAEQGKGNEALNCFERMQSEGLSPDAITFICLLKACGNTGAIDKGKQIHYEIVRRGLLEKDTVLGTALVDMYVKCSMLMQAQQVIEELPVRDAFSWSALIAGYAQEGESSEALNCYERMQGEGLPPDSVTFICILKACGSAGIIDMGKRIHEEVERWGFLENDVVLGTSLVDMYAKCGALEKAEKVFEELPIRNVVSWSALIAGYSQQGQGQKALSCFERMQGEGHLPNAVTFLSVLSACSHCGLMDEAQMLFGNMSREYGIVPNSEHHTCMVVLFGSAGCFDKALSVIRVMPSSDYPIVWLALLGSCRKWGNLKLGILTFDQAVQIDNTCAAAYILMANIFGAAGMQEDADQVEAMRLKYAASGRQGNSLWVDTRGKLHSFSIVGNTKHSQSKDIHAKIEAVSLKMSHEGCSQSAWWVLQNISGVLCGHSDKLAIACALINTKLGETIYIVNNMCLCRDCHDVVSLISKIEKRKIMVRDLNCLHIFEAGKCVCGD